MKNTKKISGVNVNTKMQYLEAEVKNKDEEIKRLKSLLQEKNSDYQTKLDQLNKELETKKSIINDLQEKIGSKGIKEEYSLRSGLDSFKSTNLEQKYKEAQQNYLEAVKNYEKLSKEFNILQKENKELRNKLSGNSNENSINGYKDISQKSYEDKIRVLKEELKKAEDTIKNLRAQNEKENKELKTKYENEMQLISSTIYNLGFNFWQMKYSYEEKLKKNKNWLDLERAKQYNGDY